MESAEVVIVGAGITGLSLAFFLERARMDVTVVDRAGIGAGASGVQPGRVRQQWSAEVNCRLARESVPALSYVSFPVLASGVYDVTPDHQPLIGRIEGPDGLWIAAGYSGHGFMLAPAISRRLAEAMVDDRGTPIPEFSPIASSPGAWPTSAASSDASRACASPSARRELQPSPSSAAGL